MDWCLGPNSLLLYSPPFVTDQDCSALVGAWSILIKVCVCSGFVGLSGTFKFDECTLTDVVTIRDPSTAHDLPWIVFIFGTIIDPNNGTWTHVPSFESCGILNFLLLLISSRVTNLLLGLGGSRFPLLWMVFFTFFIRLTWVNKNLLKTHWGCVTHICVTKPGHHWFR